MMGNILPSGGPHDMPPETPEVTNPFLNPGILELPQTLHDDILHQISAEMTHEGLQTHLALAVTTIGMALDPNLQIAMLEDLLKKMSEVMRQQSYPA